MIELFEKGGPVMWPLLIASIVVVTVVIERTFFFVALRRGRDTGAVQSILRLSENGLYAEAARIGENSTDFVARTLASGLQHRGPGLQSALLRASSRELTRLNWGLAILDTIITLAPLLGLLGTVTGMIRAFGLLGVGELETPTVITGGIAEALIATAFGLAIAIFALLPFNFLGARLEAARHEIEDNATQLELALGASKSTEEIKSHEAVVKRA